MSERLDCAVVARGLARSRSQAARLVSAGMVSVDGHPIVKPSTAVDDSQIIEIAGDDHYVSRAAHKLIAALETFPVDPRGRVVLDAGVSTGGFTQVLVERGASRVLGVDVGHGQLAGHIAQLPQVRAVEGFNIRGITRGWVLDQLGAAGLPTLVVADLSFISLGLVLQPIRDAVAAEAEFIVLVKPQFEVGRGGVREGIVRDAAARDDAVMGVLWAAWDLGLGTAGVIPSPIAGTLGNREYLAWLSAAAGLNPTEWAGRVAAIA